MVAGAARDAVHRPAHHRQHAVRVPPRAVPARPCPLHPRHPPPAPSPPALTLPRPPGEWGDAVAPPQAALRRPCSEPQLGPCGGERPEQDRGGAGHGDALRQVTARQHWDPWGHWYPWGHWDRMGACPCCTAEDSRSSPCPAPPGECDPLSLGTPSMASARHTRDGRNPPRGIALSAPSSPRGGACKTEKCPSL